MRNVRTCDARTLEVVGSSAIFDNATTRASYEGMRVALGMLMCAAISGCGGARHPSAHRASSGNADGPVSMVTSSVVVDACPDSKRINPSLANKEIQELVGPCTKIPGGSAHFSATLLPGGRVELASPSGDPDSGIVPTCLVQSQGQLRHRIKVTAPCKFDVKLEEHKSAQ